MKFRYSGTFLAKKKNQFWPIFPWKSTFSGRPCFITSLWRHKLTDFHDCGINGKRRPLPILRYQTTILWSCQFQVNRGGSYSSGRRVTKWFEKTEKTGAKIRYSFNCAFSPICLISLASSVLSKKYFTKFLQTHEQRKYLFYQPWYIRVNQSNIREIVFCSKFLHKFQSKRFRLSNHKMHYKHKPSWIGPVHGQRDTWHRSRVRPGR